MATSHRMFDDQVRKIIPGLFNMISSSADSQQSEEAYNTTAFELPNPAGKAGGACTSAFLQTLYEKGDAQQSWVDVLKAMQNTLEGMGFHQIPHLTSSRLIDVNRPMSIVPPGSGVRRALLVGIRYVNSPTGELKATWNDVLNLNEFLVEVCGFREEEVLILMDDGEHHPPTKENIEGGLVRLTRYSQPGDVCFFSFSGHGGRIADTSGDEDDGYDETLIPSDYNVKGQIVDDDLLRFFVKPMQRGVTCTVIMDCCHSGTVLDLPYVFAATDTKMRREEGFNMKSVEDSMSTSLHHSLKVDESKRENDANNGKEDPDSDEDDGMNGPMLSEEGLPQLPVRRVDDRELPAPPPPPKKCVIS